MDYLAHELRAARTEPFQGVVEVIYGEHDAEVAPRVFTGAVR
ncbi:MAG TPA: hypothetical protein VM899_10570 [Rubellimicrobium sp.]|nr:hypothetical protein [Rubellimicrobium sp.]